MGQQAQRILRLSPLEPPQLGPHAQGEFIDPDTRGLGQQEMPQLVKENDKAKKQNANENQQSHRQNLQRTISFKSVCRACHESPCLSIRFQNRFQGDHAGILTVHGGLHQPGDIQKADLPL